MAQLKNADVEDCEILDLLTAFATDFVSYFDSKVQAEVFPSVIELCDLYTTNKTGKRVMNKEAKGAFH
jgi:hypothetical protein